MERQHHCSLPQTVQVSPFLTLDRVDMKVFAPVDHGDGTAHLEPREGTIRDAAREVLSTELANLGGAISPAVVWVHRQEMPKVSVAPDDLLGAMTLQLASAVARPSQTSSQGQSCNRSRRGRKHP